MVNQCGEESGLILNILLVGFHHKHGPQLEFCHPALPGQEASSSQLPDEWKLLPSLALPDGAHNYEEDSVYFVLPSVTKKERSLFGVSCYRQIDADELMTKSEDVTRSSVQKAVVAISKVPAFGAVRQQLSLAARAYFDLKDFSQVAVLQRAYDELNHSIVRESLIPLLYTGLSVRGLVQRYKMKLLALFKLLLLERRVLLHMNPVAELTDSLVSLISLYPSILEDGLDRCASMVNSNYNIRNVSGTDFVSIDKDGDSDASVDDCSDLVRQASSASAAEPEQSQAADAEADGEAPNGDAANGEAEATQAGSGGRLQGALQGASSIITSVRANFFSRVGSKDQQHQRQLHEEQEEAAAGEEALAEHLQSPFITDDCGFPLPLFAESALFLPYVSLHQLQLLDEPSVRACLLGASNAVFKDSKSKLDAIIGADQNDFNINDRSLAKQLKLSGADEVFMQCIIDRVSPPTDATDTDTASNESERCTDDWVRAQFRIYLLSALQAAASQDPDSWPDFNTQFVHALQKTYHFRVWSAHDYRCLADAANQLHPCHGQSPIAARFSSLLTNTEQGRKVTSAVQSTGRAIEGTGRAVGGAITNARSAMSGFFTGLSSRATSRFGGVPAATAADDKDAEANYVAQAAAADAEQAAADGPQ